MVQVQVAVIAGLKERLFQKAHVTFVSGKVDWPTNKKDFE